MPTITNCKARSEGLCLEVNFNDGGPNERAILDKIDNCVYTGSFRNGVKIAASSLDCSMAMRETTSMEV